MVSAAGVNGTIDDGLVQRVGRITKDALVVWDSRCDRWMWLMDLDGPFHPDIVVVWCLGIAADRLNFGRTRPSRDYCLWLPAIDTISSSIVAVRSLSLLVRLWSSNGRMCSSWRDAGMS